MDASTLLLITVVATALAFDFTNGFHDTANAMATSIATGALGPRVAVALSAVLNFAGAFLSLSVAATIAKGIVDAQVITLTIVFAGLVGGICWNLLTWYRGLPSSSSHALIGGVVGATLVGGGAHAVLAHGLVFKVLIPAVLAPIVAIVVAGTVTMLVFRATRNSAGRGGFRAGQILSAALVSLAHGTNDAQKTMGIITLALIANGSLGVDASTPFWVIVSCAAAIALGTYLGGWRVIRTLGKGLAEIEPRQGFAAQTSSAAVILTSTHFGLPLSTTQVCTGSIIGSGLGKPGGAVRWRVFGAMVIAWVLTLPAAGLVGACAYGLASGIGGNAGIIVVFLLAAIFVGGIYLLSRRAPVNHTTVNEAWDDEARRRGVQESMAA